MNINEYIECINKAFEAKFPHRGFFVVKQQYEKTPFPIFKKLNVSIIHLPNKEEVFNFTFQDKVPKDKEAKFQEECLKEVVTTVTYNIEKILKYGN